MQLKNVQLIVKVLKLHFNPTFGFVQNAPKFGLKQPSIV